MSVVVLPPSAVWWGSFTAANATCGPTLNENAAGAETLPALSFTVTLKLNELPAVVGVPLMVPELGLRLKPAGRVPELTNQLL